jgi:amino-acid N-acetyltransferase
MFVIRTARRGDVPAILRLLQGAGLRVDGVDKHPERFWVVEKAGESPRVTGTIGMEVYGRAGLLRSFVMERGTWNGRVGMNLLLLALSAARERGLDELYLTTAGSPALFEGLGFTAVTGSELPVPIRASEHLRGAGKAGETTVMRCRLGAVSPTGEGEDDSVSHR